MGIRSILSAAALLALLAGCAAPPAGPAAPAFARIELDYEGCSCFEEVRDLKLIARRLYGGFPDLDELHQRVRVSLREPRDLELAQFARAVDGTHALTRGMTIEVRARLEGGRAILDGTGQELALEGPPFAAGELAWRKFRVKGWSDPASLRLDMIK